MIQRKQTLFLLSLVLLSVALMFIPSATAHSNGHTVNVYLLPFESEMATASIYQISAYLINIISLLLSFICIFIFKKRGLQLKLSYVLMICWLVETLILSSVSLVHPLEGIVIQNTNYGTLLGIFGMLGAYMAVYYIKKDIELLKSADRIR
jgi:hypothetical protein